MTRIGTLGRRVVDPCHPVAGIRIGGRSGRRPTRQQVTFFHPVASAAAGYPPIPSTPDDDPIGETLAWVVERLDEPIRIDELASRVAMSPRSFMRHFKAVTGTTPLDWVLRQRLSLAQRLLETTDLPLDLVAERAGFGSAITMRHHFAQRLRTSPRDYRRTFRAGGPTPA